MNFQQQEALQKAEVLVGVANRALRIANESNDVDVRQVGWLQASLCTKGLVGLSQEFPFIQLTQLEHFGNSLKTVAEKTAQLQSGDVAETPGDVP
jgi:hypothetical protein